MLWLFLKRRQSTMTWWSRFWADGNKRIPPTNIASRLTFWSRWLPSEELSTWEPRRSFPTGLARRARDSRTTTRVWRPASSRTWRIRADSLSTAFRSFTMRLVLQSSTTSGQMLIQHYHTSWIASSSAINLHMAWTQSTRYRDGIQWHDEPCFFRSKIICEDSELQMTRWTTITKAKACSPLMWLSICFLVDQLSCKWFFYAGLNKRAAWMSPFPSQLTTHRKIDQLFINNI